MVTKQELKKLLAQPTRDSSLKSSLKDDEGMAILPHEAINAAKKGDLESRETVNETVKSLKMRDWSENCAIDGKNARLVRVKITKVQCEFNDNSMWESME